jgi:hypothetical protein
MTPKMQPFWWFKKPAAPPVPTERIVDGGFEEGIAWVYYEAFRTDAEYHTGAWSCYFPVFTQPYVEQTLDIPVLGSSVISASFYIFDNGSPYDSVFYLTLYYDDDTDESFKIQASKFNEWVIVDFLSYINTAKTLTKIRFRALNEDVAWTYLIDDVSLMA